MGQEAVARGARGFGRFLASPLRSGQPPMTIAGDWVSAAGAAVFAISVFALPWLTVGLKDVFGLGEALGIRSPRSSYGLFASPWAWLLVAVLVLVLGGLWFVQARGVVSLAAGAFCLAFNVVFIVGVWQKINAIIGDVVGLARSIPFIGELLGRAVSELAKNMLDVQVAAGYWFLVPAGALLIVGGSLRLAASRRSLAVSASGGASGPAAPKEARA